MKQSRDESRLSNEALSLQERTLTEQGFKDKTFLSESVISLY